MYEYEAGILEAIDVMKHHASCPYKTKPRFFILVDRRPGRDPGPLLRVVGEGADSRLEHYTRAPIPFCSMLVVGEAERWERYPEGMRLAGYYGMDVVVKGRAELEPCHFYCWPETLAKIRTGVKILPNAVELASECSIGAPPEGWGTWPSSGRRDATL